ncbi:MAG: HEAT repeat domain-containing protein [Sulfuriferula sp.]
METIDGLVFPALTLWVMHASIYFFLISLLTLFVGLGLHKHHVLRQMKKRTALIAHNRGILISIASGSSSNLSHVETFEQALCLAEALRDQDYKDVNTRLAIQQDIVETGIKTIMLKTISAKDWGRRYQCMSAIHDLHMPVFFDALLEYAEHEENLRVYGNCLYACSSSLGKPEDFQRLSIVMDARPELSASFAEGVFRTSIRALLDAHSADQVHAVLVASLERKETSPGNLSALILSIGKEHIHALAPAIVACAIKSEDTIIKVSAMRALHAMKLCDDLIIEGLSSGNTIVQIAAIRSCEYHDGQVESSLGSLLNSPSFDVRYATAMTLRSMQERGKRVLLEVGENKTDPYAKTMAIFSLALG